MQLQHILGLAVGLRLALQALNLLGAQACLDDDVAGGRAAKAQVHFLDDRVELAGIETGEKQRAAGDFRQGKQCTGIHAADMVFVAGQRHPQAHEARFQHLGLEVHAFDEGDLVFGELPGDFSGKSHDLLLVLWLSSLVARGA